MADVAARKTASIRGMTSSANETETDRSSVWLLAQGRYSEAEPFAKEILRLGTEEFGPNNPTTAAYLRGVTPRNEYSGIYPY